MLNPFRKPETASAATFHGAIEQNGQTFDAPPDLVALAVNAWTVKLKIEALQKELKANKDALQNSLGAGAVLAVDEITRVAIVGQQHFTLTDPDACQAILGGRFTDLVRAEVDYVLSDALKAIVLDPDHPLGVPLRACIQVKDSVSVSLRAGKPL